MKFWAMIGLLTACAMAGDGVAQPTKMMGEPAATTEFSLFSEFCVAHEGDFAGATAALRARKFEEYDTTIRSSEGGLGGLGFTTTVNGTVYDISVAQLSIYGEASDPDSMICIVSSASTEQASLAAARTWVAVPMSGQPPGQELYMYRQTATGRVPLQNMDSREARAAMKAGEYRQFNIATGPQGAELFFLSQ